MAADNESKTAVALVDPLVGSIFDKRFRIDARIAQGGFGAIYRATHVKSGHPIALKVLLPTLAQDLGIVARFRREGDTLTALRNPHTITAYELGQAADRTLFIVMELLHGESLFDRYEQQGPFQWQRMLRIARQVCESLAEAHALGIVHRDLKPTNIHLEDIDGDPDFVKVLDFGIAKILRGSESFDASDITNAGTMIGTLDYMSPEQMVGGQVTGQTDIYTVGIVMYEMIAGVRPFPEAQTAAAALGAMLKTTPQPLYLRAPVPEHVSKIVMRCLDRETNRRYRSVGDLMTDIDAVLGDASSASIDATNTFDIAATTRAPKSLSGEDEATTFTPPPEKLLDSMRTPRVERLEEWDDGDESATTVGGAATLERARLEAARHEDRIARDVRSDRAVSRAETNIARDVRADRAVSRAETHARDGVDPHGPTIAARPIEGTGEHAPIVRAGSDGAKSPMVARSGSEGAKTPTLERDSDAKTPTAQRDSDAKTPTVRREGDSAMSSSRREGDGGMSASRADSEGAKTPIVPPTGARSDFDVRSSSGRPVPDAARRANESGARPPADAARRANESGGGASFDAARRANDSGGRPPAELDGRARPSTVPPSSGDSRGRSDGRARSPTVQPAPDARARPQTVPPSPIPSTPPPRPLQSRNLATPVPSVVVAPFSSTPRRPTPPPTGIPTPIPGSLPPGVPMPPSRPTPQPPPGSYPPGVPIPPTPHPGQRGPQTGQPMHGMPMSGPQTGQPMHGMPMSGPQTGQPMGPHGMPMPGQLTMPQGAPGMPRPNIATPLPGGPSRGVPTPPPGAGYQPPHGVPTPPPGAAYQPPPAGSARGVPTPPPGAAYQPPHGVPTPPPGAAYQPQGNPNPFAAGQAPGSNPSASPFVVPGSNPSANPFAVPASNPAMNPFAIGQAPGSNPSASPFPPNQQPGSNPANPYNAVSLPQYDMSRMAAREDMIRRLVWIAVIAVATIIGVVILAR